MKIVFIHSHLAKDDYQVQYRCRNLAQAINLGGEHTALLIPLDEFVGKSPAAQRACAEADILVIQRYLFEPVVQSIYPWKARDKRVVVDLDIPVDWLDRGHPDYSFWYRGARLDGLRYGKRADTNGAVPLEQLCGSLNLADAITVSSLAMVRDWQAYGWVQQVPDYLNTNELQTLKNTLEGEVWIGLGGEQGNLACLGRIGLAEALMRVCEQRERVKILIACLEDVTECLPRIPAEKIKHVRPFKYFEWTTALARMDIGLIPACGRYDERSSGIRVMEHMVMKTPWIASDAAPYRGWQNYGWLVPDSAELWERMILEVLDHQESYQQEAAGEPYFSTLGRDVNENRGRLLEIYEAILARPLR